MNLSDRKRKIIASVLWFSFTVSVFICLLELAFWQYDRGFEKEQRVQRIEQLNQSSPLSLTEVVQLSQASQFTGKDSVNDFPVKIVGIFADNKVFLLDNQVENHSLGYRVLQAIETKKHAVLINLGWVQGSIDRNKLPDISPLQGNHQFTGHVRLVEKGITLKQQDFTNISWPLRIQQIELNKFSTLLDKPLLPYVIYVDETETLGYKKNWHPIVMPADKHFAYAFQWAALAIAWMILMISFRIKSLKAAGFSRT